MSKLGEVFQVSIFGESHNSTIGLTIDNIAPGIKVDLEEIKKDLTRRRPQLKSETSRKEADDFEIISGFFNGYTTGMPLTILIKNNDIKSHDYNNVKDTYRPSHADYPADIHSLGYRDYRGGGSYSGRLMAPIVIAGSIAKMILLNLGVHIETHIKQVADIYDEELDYENLDKQIKQIRSNYLSMISSDQAALVKSKISDVKQNNDSIGAILETIAINVEVGLGEPFFNRLDSVISRNIMSIPAIKGVSFGLGFDYVDELGSTTLDEYYYDENNQIKLHANNNGGIIGGHSSGDVIIVNSIVKPTATISQSVRTVNKECNENIDLIVKGRHDSSIFTRMPVIINSMVALALVDLYTIRYGYMIQRGAK